MDLPPDPRRTEPSGKDGDRPEFAPFDATSNDVCDQVVLRLSAYLDGRLSATIRGQLQEHLKRCDECLLTLQELRDLSRLARAVERPQPQPDLADRVRRSLSSRREGTLRRLGQRHPEWQRTASIAAAACLLAATAGAIGFHVGQGAAPRPNRPTSTAQYASLLPGSALNPSDPEWQPYREQGFQPDRFSRASRGLLHDLQGIDRVPAALRRPLVAAQLDQLGLRDQSRLWRRIRPVRLDDGLRPWNAVAEFVTRVSAAVDEREGDLDFQRFQREVRDHRLLHFLPAAPLSGQHQRHAQQIEAELQAVLAHNGIVIERWGGGLSHPERRALRSVLDVRVPWVFGHGPLTAERVIAVGRPGPRGSGATGSIERLLVDSLPRMFDGPDIHFIVDHAFSMHSGGVSVIERGGGSLEDLDEVGIERMFRELFDLGANRSRLKIQRFEVDSDDPHAVSVEIRVDGN